jgi:hypothetical protein
MLEDVLVPIFVMMSLCSMIFGIVYVKSKETMAMIDKGINPRFGNPGPRPVVYFGLLLLGAGLGLLAAFFIDQNMNHNAVTPNGEVYYKKFDAIYFSLIAIGGGLGLVISYFVDRKHQVKNNQQIQ